MALILFLAATSYAVWNGMSLREKQQRTIQEVEESSKAKQLEFESLLSEGKKGPEDQPWVDMTTPLYGLFYSQHYAAKAPSPMMVFAIGQAEQFGFYKKINFNSSPYDADLSAEISNPERVAFGSLDLTFCLVFLLPLLLIVLSYSIGGYEQDMKLSAMIRSQTASYIGWLSKRTSSIGLGITLIVICIVFFTGWMSSAWVQTSSAMFNYLLLVLIYLWVWVILITAIKSLRLSQIYQTMVLTLVWVVFAIVIPGGVHQSASLKFPSSILVEFIDANRLDREEINEKAIDEVWTSIKVKYPDLSIPEIHQIQDSTKLQSVESDLYSLAFSMHISEVSDQIEASFQEKNDFIENTYWFNPLIGLQNQLFSLSETDFYAYRDFRLSIQDARIILSKTRLTEQWNQQVVDLDRYRFYQDLLAKE